MKRIAMSAAIIATAFATTATTHSAQAKGCIKGAIVGGVAGHYAGGHGKLGALAGCVIGRHEANKADKRNAQQQNTSN